MIVLNGLTKRQAVIAQLLWTAETWEQTEAIVQAYGKEANTVRYLLALACIDEEVQDEHHCKQAREMITNVSKG